MHQIHHAHVPHAVNRGQPAAWIHIQRGMTRFPARPVASSRFLIGSGTNCHLQLGGDFPMLHSVVMRTSDGWEIEAIAVEPDLSVNGHRTQRHRLQAGDHVQVGPFQFHWETDAVFRGAGPAPETADSLQNT